MTHFPGATPQPNLHSEAFRPRLAFVALYSVISVAVLGAGCGGEATPAAVDPDPHRACAEAGLDAAIALDCSEGEVCLLGRCYQACSDGADCGPGQSCSAGGVCEADSTPRADAGQDAGEDLSCADGTLCLEGDICHPAGGCTECAPGEIEACSASEICDYALGNCVDPQPADCRPCEQDSDCNEEGGFQGSCTERRIGGATERVCLRRCDTTACLAGLTCNADQLCEPSIGLCTAWRLAGVRTQCQGDDDCTALGGLLSEGPGLGACDRVVMPDAGVDGGPAEDAGPVDAGLAEPGTCQQLCLQTSDCIASGAGEECLTDGRGSFCQIP